MYDHRNKYLVNMGWGIIAIYVSTLQKIECIKGIWRNFHFMEEIETFWISF